MARKYTGAEKSAIFLMCLGEKAAARIFDELTDDEVNAITSAMANIHHIPHEIRAQVFQEYQDAQHDFAGIFLRGEDFAKNAIARTPGELRSQMLLNQFLSRAETKSLETISHMSPRMVAGLLEQEHPQTVALILSTQEPEHSAAILGFLPEEMHTDVSYRISKIDKVSPGVLTGIENALQHEIGLVSNSSQKQVGGVDTIVGILNNVQNNLDDEILEEMEEFDPAMVEEIKKRMFTFEDLIALDGRALQMILREINNNSLTVALKTASEDIKNKIFANMSERAADMIRDDLEAMGPVRLSEVETTQQSIVRVALKLEEEGKIILGSGGGGDELV